MSTTAWIIVGITALVLAPLAVWYLFRSVEIPIDEADDSLLASVQRHGLPLVSVSRIGSLRSRFPLLSFALVTVHTTHNKDRTRYYAVRVRTRAGFEQEAHVRVRAIPRVMTEVDWLPPARDIKLAQRPVPLPKRKVFESRLVNFSSLD